MRLLSCRRFCKVRGAEYEACAGSGSAEISDGACGSAGLPGGYRCGFCQGNIGKAVKLATSEYFNEIKNAALHILKNAPRMDISEISAAVKGVSRI